MKKVVKTLIVFFSFPIKTFFNWILNQCPKGTHQRDPLKLKKLNEGLTTRSFKTQVDFMSGWQVRIKLSHLSSNQFGPPISLIYSLFFYLKTCSFHCFNTILNTQQSTFNSVDAEGKFKMRNFWGTFIAADLQRSVSQPFHTLIKAEVRMFLNTYEIAIKFLIVCLTLPFYFYGQ